jgi:hypothetical protein
MNTNTYTDDDLRRVVGIVNEQIDDKLDLLLEVVSDMQQKVNALPRIETEIAELKADMKVVRAAVTDTSRQVHDIDRRVTRLEAAV